jgi:putative phosphoribosyl transferase
MSTQTAMMEREVKIQCGHRHIRGSLHVLPDAKGIVVFAHGSGSGRFSPRNQFVARVLEQSGLATLLIDLLEEDEANDRAKVFDIPFLAERLQTAVNWVIRQPDLTSLKLGYFGASTGAGAALVAAARRPSIVSAIVSRGGRPDLAADDLPIVRAPTLLIVGGNDDVVIELNEQAAASLECDHQLVVVPGATHLFEEPGTLEEVARLAADWFSKHLTGNRTRSNAIS